MEYSFCESVHGTGVSRWHIRRLTDAGKKLGGGIDTPSLCGRVMPPYGWDLDVQIDARTLEMACTKCQRAMSASG